MKIENDNLVNVNSINKTKEKNFYRFFVYHLQAMLMRKALLFLLTSFFVFDVYTNLYTYNLCRVKEKRSESELIDKACG
jgi:hypothetical protein